MPSEIAVDRTTRKRQKRTQDLLEIAGELFSESGLDGVTLAGIAERADLATPSLYNYFGSKSELIASLQISALRELADELQAELDQWVTERSEVEDLAQLVAFSDLFLEAPRRFPRAFGLQQELLARPQTEEQNDAAAVVPAALELLAIPAGLIAAAADSGALGALAGASAQAPETQGADFLDEAGGQASGPLGRTVIWVSALNGVLLADSLTVGLPAAGPALGRRLTFDLLAGWGADGDQLAGAAEVAAGWFSQRLERDRT